MPRPLLNSWNRRRQTIPGANELTPADAPISVDNIYTNSGNGICSQNLLRPRQSNRIAGINPTTVIELMSHSAVVEMMPPIPKFLKKGHSQSSPILIAKGIQPGRLLPKIWRDSPKTVTKKTGSYLSIPKRELHSLYLYWIARRRKTKEICHQINRRTEFKVLSSDYKEKFEK